MVFKGYLICMKRTDITRNCGMIGVLVRIPTVLLGYYGGLGLLGFALPCVVDFSAKALYVYLSARKVNSKILCE